jgi:hypothetical protein
MKKKFPAGFEIAKSDTDFSLQAVGEVLKVILKGEFGI